MPRRPLEVVALLCLLLALPVAAGAQQPGLIDARHHDFFLRQLAGTQQTGSGSAGADRVR